MFLSDRLAAMGTQIYTVKMAPLTRVTKHSAPYRDAVFSLNGSFIYTSSTRDGSALTGNDHGAYVSASQPSEVSAPSFSPDGKQFVYGKHDGPGSTMQVWKWLSHDGGTTMLSSPTEFAVDARWAR